jgi:predicted dinucleotide-binding enzyme
MLLCGDDAGAKARVTEVLTGWFGWSRVVDLGDITAARGTESWLPLWIRLWGALKTPDFNLRLVVARAQG